MADTKVQVLVPVVTSCQFPHLGRTGDSSRVPVFAARAKQPLTTTTPRSKTQIQSIAGAFTKREPEAFDPVLL